MSYYIENPYLNNYWNCISCNYHNKGTRTVCFRCRETRDSLPISIPQTESELVSESTTNLTEQTENSIESSTDNLCTICLTNRRNSIFLHGNTAHQGACYQCARRCNNVCPLCRQRVDRVVRLY
jgi:hypothetical protein